MKKIILSLFFMALAMPILHSQVAIGVEAEGSLYQWYKKPRSHPEGAHSAGQFASILAVGPKVWFGNWDDWTISLEGKVDFSVLSFDAGNYSGLGSISFPTLVKGNFNPFPKVKNGEIKIGIGLGAQWTKSELFAKQDRFKGIKNPFFVTYIGEVSMQVVFGTSRGSSDGHSFEFFVRPGWGREGARSLNLGMKYNYRINFNE